MYIYSLRYTVKERLVLHCGFGFGLTSILLQIILLSHGGDFDRRDGCSGGDYERNKEEAITMTKVKDGNNVDLAAEDVGGGDRENKMEEAALQ
ncbi:hypothetical protein L195_g043714 [Trifolium pratense]|uniref:Uncharacterized protein n=1 Tax=Trifolium pratense TaxID=57577 RepID=A0A2K3MA12_TRIPR|nr:hypothetical protein L195_g043714 [Trifolium pratense]